MKAAVTTELGAGFRVEDIDIDDPREREVLVRVKASGLCHSDLTVSVNDYGVPMPAVFGHEIAGVVEAIGPDVTEFVVGDHVVASLVHSCFECDRCRAGKPWQCTDPNKWARTPDDPAKLSRGGERIEDFQGIGGFAEYSLVSENQLVKIPEEVPFDAASVLGCGVVTGAGAAINSADVSVGDTVAVFGCGGVGLNVIQGARLAGAKTIIAIDLAVEKFELARKFGATHVVNPADGDTVEQIRALTGGVGVDKAFEVIGLNLTVRQALESLAMGGQVYVVGLQRPDSTFEFEFDPDLMVGQNTIQGVHMGTSSIKDDIAMFAQFYLQGRFNLDDLVSKHIGLEEIDEAYVELKTGKTARSVVVFD
ncbi:Zn-dependent alcohol dehydrogenase [Microbacterium trichothecenolyticum]|uniref:Zn-dependent alcohol dehydrogenase n=1 Tax=Microbacterium trichothecenolyticum TaxID=69370 RepID=UPI001C6EBDE9|nr:Zn-dependent alcohol dehydrogenase [Microbacterium trichothecenolyticum]MBW9122071.1 Zn-dependent alcohol dehydrogenase [Microbacterium trichothecenolyticum]